MENVRHMFYLTVIYKIQSAHTTHLRFFHTLQIIDKIEAERMTKLQPQRKLQPTLVEKTPIPTAPTTTTI